MEWIDKYFEFLLEQLAHDTEMFTHWWMWVFICIPAVIYFVFCCIKWSIILFPVLLALKVTLAIFDEILKTIRVIFKRK